MQKYTNDVRDQRGNVVSGALVAVTKTSDGTSAVLYSDNGVTSTGGNTVTTDALGQFSFYVADGRYTLTITGAGIAQAIVTDVLIEDPADVPSWAAEASGAAAIGNTPAGNIAAATVQGALNELDAEKASLAALAAAGGAALVGNGGETVADSLNALQLADYTALRAYAGPRKSVYVTGYLGTSAPSGIAGMFRLRADLDPATATDNGGTRIVGVHVWDRVYVGAASPLWFQADPSGVADSASAIQATANASLLVDLGEATFKLGAPISATVHHRILGRGFGKTTLDASGLSDYAIKVLAPVSDTMASLDIDGVTILGKYGVKVGGDRTSHPTDGAIIGARINVRVVGTYGASSGDAAYNTDKVRDSSNTLVSSATATSIDVLKTFTDVSAYGVGLWLSKCIDTRVVAPQFYGNGVAVALIGCDLTRWEGGRAHEVGLFFYDERVGTWGSQNKLIGVDLLHNRRAGGMTFNESKFSGATGCYYECYSDSALLALASLTEGVAIDDNRIDDPYYTGSGGSASGTTPLALFYNPRWNNHLCNRFQKFSSFTAANPPVRVVGSSVNCDSNHPEVVALENPNGYSPIRYKTVEIGCRYGALVTNAYTPTNVPHTFSGNLSPLAVADGAKNVFYSAAVRYPSPKFNLLQARTSYTLAVNAKTISGTAIYFSIDQHAADGTVKASVFGATVGGFNTTTFSTQTQALTVSDPADGDYLTVTWQSDTAKVAGMALL